MELLTALLVCGTVAISNFFVIKSLKSYSSSIIEMGKSEPIEAVLEVTDSCNCGKEIMEAILPLVQPHTPPVSDDIYHAWKNKKEEPRVAPPSQHGAPPKPGPLERPYGFSR